MNAREQLINDLIPGLDKLMLRETAINLRAIDALTAELTEWAISYIEPFSGEHLESHPIKLLMDKAKALGYSPEDKSETN